MQLKVWTTSNKKSLIETSPSWIHQRGRGRDLGEYMLETPTTKQMASATTIYSIVVYRRLLQEEWLVSCVYRSAWSTAGLTENILSAPKEIAIVLDAITFTSVDVFLRRRCRHPSLAQHSSVHSSLCCRTSDWTLPPKLSAPCWAWL